jgi:hypothetical protein
LTPCREFHNQLMRVRRGWTLIKFSVWSQKNCGNNKKNYALGGARVHA